MNFKRGLYYILLLLLFVVGDKMLHAQTDSLEVHTIKGKKYYIHIAEKGNTLYSLLKKYNVPVDVIKKENPSVLDGLSIGEKIFIPVKRNEEEVSLTGVNGNYIKHKVKKGQTLYSIAKEYNLLQKEIVSANLDVKDGLQKGQIINIPIKEIKSENSIIIDTPKKSKYKTHRVETGNTLYSLSKYYNVSIDSIKIVNGGLVGGLQLGETIYIPIKEENEGVINEIKLFADSLISNDSNYKKGEYKIALLLPFYISKNKELNEDRNVLSEKSVYPKSKIAIEFYNGVLAALDSLSDDSLKFQLFVYDTQGRDSLATAEILLKEELKEVDLMIGPLYGDNFKKAALFSQENQIPIVSPVKQSNKLLLGNQFVFKAVPSNVTALDKVVKLVVDSFKTENLMVVVDEAAKEKKMAELLVKLYNNQLEMITDTLIYSSIKTIKTSKSVSLIIENLKVDQNNVIYVPSSNQTFITDMFSTLTTTLNKKDYKNCKVTLIGLEQWLKFENIDLEYFQTLNVHFSTNQFIDYNDSLTSSWVKKYVAKNETYPSKYAFSGFDIAFSFGRNFSDFGTVFTNSKLNAKGFSINLDFYKTGVESGFENKEAFMVRFKDYVLSKIE